MQENNTSAKQRARYVEEESRRGEEAEEDSRFIVSRAFGWHSWRRCSQSLLKKRQRKFYVGVSPALGGL